MNDYEINKVYSPTCIKDKFIESSNLQQKSTTRNSKNVINKRKKIPQKAKKYGFISANLKETTIKYDDKSEANLSCEEHLDEISTLNSLIETTNNLFFTNIDKNINDGNSASQLNVSKKNIFLFY